VALPPVLPAHIAALDLDPARTFVAASGSRLFGIFTVDMKGRASFVDLAIVNDYGNVEFFNDKMCPCKKALREPGRSQCAACRERGRAKLKRYRRRRRAKERACTTESSSTPC
jgi:hypothetical protein